jgi:hypothetical protein
MVKRLGSTTHQKDVLFVNTIVDVRQLGIELFEKPLTLFVYKMNV